MNIHTKVSLVVAALAAFLLPVAAQTTQDTQPETAQKVNQRQEHQQDRISDGIASGRLTAGEAANLENKEGQLNQEKRDMRKLDDGHLSSADRATLQQQQNQLSRQIYQDKHNAAAIHNTDPKSEIGQREQHQRGRIAEGIQSGQLTTGEAANLEHREAAVNREVRNDRAANGGKLTAQERSQINRQQNKVSRQIYRDKHNGRSR